MNNWTEQEKWVWYQIKSGNVADFNELPEWKAGGELDLKAVKDKTEPWPEFRKISSKFLTDILFGKDEKGGKYIDSAPVQGIRIYGAWFYEPVDISGGALERNLVLKSFRFDEDIAACYITSKGFVSLNGSAFFGKFNLNAADICVDLFMDNCEFKGSVNLKGIKVGGQVSIKRTNFSKELAMDGMKVDGNLFMEERAFFQGEVRLLGADIGGQVSVKGSNFSKELAMDRMKVGGSLFMDEGAVFDGEGEVRLHGANIGRQISMKRATFKKKLALDGMNVGGDLFMDEGAVFEGEVRLHGADIGGVVSMKGSTFSKALTMDGMNVGENLFMDGGAVFEREVRLPGADIGGQVNMDGAIFKNKLIMENATALDMFFRDVTLNGNANLYCLHARNNLLIGPIKCELGEDVQKIMIGLDSAVIGKKLFLKTNSSSDENFWEKATINLSHARAGIFAASDNSWPDSAGRIDLTGFTYDRIEDLGKEENKSGNIGTIPWLGKMLKSQSPFAPQPYEQLAKVLMAEGCRERAEEILFQKRAKERETTKRKSRKILFWMEEEFIGYGYKNSRILIPTTVLIILGILFVQISGEASTHNLSTGILYSVDMLLPFVEFNKKFAEIHWNYWPTQIYFYFQQLMGYVLAIFITAGLTGLTKK